MKSKVLFNNFSDQTQYQFPRSLASKRKKPHPDRYESSAKLYPTLGPHTRTTSPELVLYPEWRIFVVPMRNSKPGTRRKRNGPGSKSMATLVRSSSFRSTRDTRREVSERNEQRAKRVWTFDLLSYGLVYLRGVVNHLAKQKYIYIYIGSRMETRWKYDERKVLREANRRFWRARTTFFSCSRSTTFQINDWK